MNLRPSHPRIIGLALIAACSSQSAPSAVTGNSTTKYLTLAGAVTRPDDLSHVSFTVFTGDELESLPSVTGNADGTVVIPDVPDGPFLVERVGPSGVPQWDRYDDHAIVSTTTRIGDPDATPASAPTPVDVTATGLAAWSDSDTIVADCFANGTEIYGVEFDPALAAGATTIGSSFDWDDPLGYSWNTTGTPYLMSANDSLVLSRIAHESDASGISTDVLTQTMTVAGIAQTDGQAATASGAFVTTPATSTVTMSIDLDSFAAALPAANASWGMSTLASPGSIDNLQYGPTLVAVSGARGTGTATSGAVSYGDPFDASWPVMVFASYGAERTYTLPDHSTQSSFSAISQTTALQGSSFTFTAAVPLVHVKVGGLAVDSDGAVISATTSPVAITVALPDGIDGFTASLVDLAAATAPVIALSSTSDAIELPASAFAVGHSYALRVGIVDATTGIASETATGMFSFGH
jgi:hypothetical protein